MGNSSSSPDMSQTVVKIDSYERRPVGGRLGALLVTLMDSKHSAVIATTKNGRRYRIEKEDMKSDDSSYKEWHRNGKYRILLIPDSELLSGEWMHRDSQNSVTGDLTLQNVFDAACGGSDGQQPSDEGTDGVVSRVKKVAEPKWHEVFWMAVPTAVVVLLIIFGFVCFFPVSLVVLLLVILLLRFGKYIFLRQIIGCAMLVMVLCFYLYGSPE